ncbi:MAG: hypothetical protein OEW75_09655 [Cyclobacteriaceae bacterium]|nr:hypothetical protein [Cyclobacteriaceae bacterium]
MKTKNTLVAIALFLGFAFSASAQCKEWKWPEDKSTAEEKYVLHNDLIKNNQYAQAIAPHQWLLINAPDLQSAIYINGEKIYSSLADAEKDAVKKSVYVDSLMIIYDLRMQYCGEEGYVSDRKALMAFKYNYKDRTKAEWLLELFEKSFEINGSEMMDVNFKYYMTTIQLNKFYNKTLTEEQILEKYDKIQNALDEKLSNESDPKKAKKIRALKDDVDDILTKTIDLNCDKVKTIMGPKFEANPEDTDTAEKIFAWMLKGKCTDEPLWLESGKAVFKVKPDYGLAKNIALKSKSNDDNESAKYYFQEALKIAQTNEDKGETLINLGHIEREAGRKVDARVLYRQAADLGASDAYTYIGYMYMQSFEICAQKVSKVEDRAVFIAAYKMFQLAGNAKQMAEAKKQFPSVSEIFEETKKEGDPIRVGCWINEAVTLQARD